MLLWLSSSRSEMTSGRAGARADRSRSSKKRNILASLAFCLLPVLALVAGPATSVFAVEYPSNVTGVSVSVDNVTVSPFILESAVAFQDNIDNDTNAMLVTVSSMVTFRVLCSYDDTSGGVVAGNLVVNVAHPAINVSSLTNNTRRLEMVSCTGGDGVNAYVMNPAAQGQSSSNVQIWVTRLNQRPTFGAFVTCKVIYTFRGTHSQADTGYQTLLATTPTITVSYSNGELSVQSLESLLPDLNRIYRGLLDPQTGWLPTINTNLQTMVTSQITTNSWLTTLSGQQTTANNYLSSIYGQAQVANGHLTDVKANQVEQIGQLQQIVDYVNSTQAAAAVDDARQDFIQDAGAMESQQSVLEGAADASVGAVDMNDINIIDNFSQSVTFWGQLVAQLPSILGSIWSVFIFGLLLAFVLFVLRIRR